MEARQEATVARKQGKAVEELGEKGETLLTL
jgi:hypothetical protein